MHGGHVLWSACLAVAGLGACADSVRAAPPSAAPAALAVTGVTVIPVDPPGALPDHTVIVRHGRIEAMGPSDGVRVPADAAVIEGRGRYLIPGLADMHAHLCDPRDLPRLVALGITTVRHMAELPGWVQWVFGFPDGRSLRHRVATGRLVGPVIHAAGLVLDGRDRVSPFHCRIETPAQAAREVDRQAALGVDFIKVYDMLSATAFHAVVAAARRHGLPVAGHVPFAVTLGPVLDAGLASIDHLTGFVDHNRAANLFAEGSLESWAARTRASGTAVCPTLVVWHNIPPRGRFADLRSQPGFARLPWRVKWLWKTTMGYVHDKAYTGSDFPGDMIRLSGVVTRALHAAGCRIIAGTDMNFLGVYPGDSLHRELELLVGAGLSPHESLAAATLEAARTIGRAAESGSIAPGKRADLVLLDADPLADIRHTRRISGVCAAGRWFGPADLVELAR